MFAIICQMLLTYYNGDLCEEKNKFVSNDSNMTNSARNDKQIWAEDGGF